MGTHGDLRQSESSALRVIVIEKVNQLSPQPRGHGHGQWTEDRSYQSRNFFAELSELTTLYIIWLELFELEMKFVLFLFTWQ